LATENPIFAVLFLSGGALALTGLKILGVGALGGVGTKLGVDIYEGVKKRAGKMRSGEDKPASV
jgi:hypothetical protein